MLPVFCAGVHCAKVRLPGVLWSSTPVALFVVSGKYVGKTGATNVEFTQPLAVAKAGVDGARQFASTKPAISTK
jgi:hypothetical protein